MNATSRDTVPDAALPTFDEPPPVALPPVSTLPALPQAGVDVGAVTAALVSASPTVPAGRDGGVRTIDLSGGSAADAPLPRRSSQPQWFHGAEEGRDVNPRNVGFAVALAVVVLALALLVKAH